MARGLLIRNSSLGEGEYGILNIECPILNVEIRPGAGPWHFISIRGRKMIIKFGNPPQKVNFKCEQVQHFEIGHSIFNIHIPFDPILLSTNLMPCSTKFRT